MTQKTMSCPNCKKGTIHYILEELLMGKSFSCDTCEVTIALGSQFSDVSNGTFKKLDDLKKDNS